MKSSLTAYLLAALCLAAATVAAPAQTFTVLNEPDAGDAASQGTMATCINTAGTIAGIYIDSSGNEHGFVRSAAGDYTTFNPPNDTYKGGMVSGINASGAIGIWIDDLAWLAWAVAQFRRGARAGIDNDGESYVYLPDSGEAGRIAWALAINERDYQRMRWEEP